MNTTPSTTLSPPSSNGHAHLPTPSCDANQDGKRLQEWIGRIESLPDGEARELVYNCLHSIMALHRDGLARVMQLVKNAGSAGGEVSSALVRDKLVRSMLLIHGLHPIPLEARLHEALDKVRPYMKSHGGNVELISLEDDVARLRLEGTCKSCPSSAVTLELAVRQAVEEACPDLLGFEVEGAVKQNAATDHAPAAPPAWTVVEDMDELQDGNFRALEIRAVPVLLARAGGHFYAYRDRCPACDTAFGDALLESNMLSCRFGHRFDVQRAGLCPDNPEIHLEPFPLLAANGMVRISVR
jgi:Fe-S cluster biogenesis protein NfuA/nitrite reductase/ring-hydroxylating ferredoxin subunit